MRATPYATQEEAQGAVEKQQKAKMQRGYKFSAQCPASLDREISPVLGGIDGAAD